MISPAKDGMGGIFINYRRHDHRNGFAEELRERLAQRFSDHSVFLDVDSINLGDRYPNSLRGHLEQSGVVLVLIHQGWAHDLRNGQDWVRWEIEESIRSGKTIVPVLLDHADVPTAKDLPPEIEDLAVRQGHRILLHERGQGIDALADELERLLESVDVGQTPGRGWAGVLAGAAALVAVVAALVFFPRDEDELALWIFPRLVVIMALVAAVLGGLSLARRRINRVDETTQPLEPKTYHAGYALPVGVLGAAVIVAMVFSSPIAPAVRPGVLLVAAVAVAGLVSTVLQGFRTERDREENWPVALTAPVRPAPVRREVERLRRKVLDGNSAAVRKRVTWHIAHLRRAAEVLTQDANRGRWSWVSGDHPVALVGYALWAAVAVGVLGAAGLPRLAGLIGATVIVTVIAAVTLEIEFRRQRWVRREVAKEVYRAVVGIERRLAN